MLSLNQNSLLKRFLDSNITLLFYWGSVLLKQLYNLDLKLKEKLPRKVRTIIRSIS